MLFPDQPWILALALCLNALWWRYADRRARAWRGAIIWRGLLALFMSLQALYVGIALVAPFEIRSSVRVVPLAYHTQAYIWHMVALPAIVLAAAGFGLVRWWRQRPVKAALPARQLVAVGAPSLPIDGVPESEALTTRLSNNRRDGNGSSGSSENSTTGNSTGLSRRQMLASAALTLPPLASVIIATRAVSQLRELRTNPVTVWLSTLPPALDGVTIAQVTDLHIGRFLHEDRLPGIAKQVNDLQADFTVFTGDLIDLSLEDCGLGVDFLKRLKIRSGFAICEGNHDLVDNRGEFERTLIRHELPLLLSATKTFQFRGRPVQFLGIPWNTFDAGHYQAVKMATPLVDPDAFPILLAHHPHAFDAAAAANLPLTLSGHTHGGQLMINERLGAGTIRFRYVSGLYRKNNSSLLVCNGIGNWFPVRINAPAEIMHITLRAGQG